MDIEKASVEIQGRSSNGKGIVYTDHGTICIGPIREEGVGEQLEVLSMNGFILRILTYPPRPTQFRRREYPNRISDLNKGEIFTAKADGQGNNRSVVSQLEDGNLNFGPLHDNSIGSHLTAYYLGKEFALALEPSYFQKSYKQYSIEASSGNAVPSPDPIIELCATDASADFTNSGWTMLQSTEKSDGHKQDHFELGMTVHDKESDSPDTGVIVNLPSISAERFVAYREGKRDVTVAEDNPKCDPTSKVVVVVFQDDLAEHQPEYDGENSLSMSQLSRKNIPFYAFPPERLEIDRGGSPLSGKTKSGAEILTDDGSDYKYKVRSDSVRKQSKLTDETVRSTCASTKDKLTQDFEHDVKQSSADQNQNSSAEENPASGRDDSREQPTDDLKTTTQDRAGDIQTSMTQNQKKKETVSRDVLTESDYRQQTNSTSDNITKLRELRKKAEKEATEDPVRAEVEYTGPQYQRSRAIRKYALTRANGTCEFCNQEAPFVKPDGSPYLEVHHVDELSEGGADHPSLVAALCPTCHKEIHHGRQGNKINEQLRKLLKEGLGRVGVTK